MTREEEAIKELKKAYPKKSMLVNHRIKGGFDDHDSPLGQALDMAIKALETLEEFERAQIITGGRLNGRTYAYKCGLEDGKRKALEQTRWIPCSERLPEKTGLYLINIGDLVTTANFEGHYFRRQSMVKYVPDAWMPLPEPYKTDNKNKQGLAYADQDTLMSAT